MILKNLFFSFLSLLLISACQNENEKMIERKYKAELSGYAKEYMMGLKSVLVKNMQKGGPIQAINVCSDTASDLTNIYSKKNGVIIKRFSTNNRNQNNFPNNYENEVIKKFKKLMDIGELNGDSYLMENVKVEGKDGVTFTKPIFIDAPCLNCHGTNDQISDDVKQVLTEKYPEDKATDYEIGDLRGAISVTKLL